MLIVDHAVLSDPQRVAAVDRCRVSMPARHLSLDAVARLAARLLRAPMAAVTLVGRDEEFLIGTYGLEERLGGARRLPLEYSVCKFVVCADHVLGSDDMRADADPQLCEHLLVQRFGVRAFLSVPVRDAADRPLGALTVLDTEPRSWTGEDTATLLEIEQLLDPGEDVQTPPVASEGFLTALLDSVAVGVSACDDSGEIVLMNRELRRIHRLPEQGPIPPGYGDRADHTLFDEHGRSIPWERTPLMRALAGENVSETDIVKRVPGYRDRIFAVTARPIVGADDTRLGAVAASHEVTAIRRVERFRACHLEVDRALASTASIGDAAPLVLRAVARTLGWPAAELFLADETDGGLRAAGHWSSWSSEPDEFFGHSPVLGAGVTGRVWQTGHPVWVDDITEIPYLCTPFERHRVEVCERNGIRSAIAVPVRDAETVLGVLTCYAGAGEDHEDMLTVLLEGVAAQIGVYVALRHARQLTRQLARAGDDLIALVGHELRTPITSITALASMLAEDGPGLPPEDRQMIDSLVRNASSLQRMIDTLLDLAGLDGGHLPLKLRRTDLSSIVQRAVHAARDDAAGHGVRLQFDDPGPLPLDGDPERLGQVVGDLLSNAVNYTPAGGGVRVSAGDDDGILRLAITDSGIGTPKDEHDRVFDRFFRGSNVRHHGSSGSGLGLSLARTIVRLHAGTIELADNHPTGTTVSVALPGLRDDDPPGLEFSAGLPG